MKLVANILSIYMLLLTLVPCSDGMDFIYSDCSFESEIVDNSHNNPDHDHEDHCTPFCSCACCGSMTTVSLIDYREVNHIVSILCIHNYQSIYSFDFNKGVWHPPALS